ncbi:MAG: hypothetical protein AB9866_23225 [Syntrophobacteraceae bacterium]
MEIETAAELMQPSTDSGKETGLQAQFQPELTDEQSFRELVESLVRYRPVGETRKTPRFSTPAALGGLENSEYDGFLFSEAHDPACGCDPLKGSAPDSRGDAGKLYGIRIVDFSENGVQIEFKCNSTLHLLQSRLFMKIGDARIPVVFKWCRQSQSTCRGGIFFGERIKFDRELAGIISALGINLVDYLIKGFKTNKIPFSKQAGVYTYLAIFYSLRLLLLESIAVLRELETTGAGAPNGASAPGSPSACRDGNGIKDCRGLNKHSVSLFMKPYHDFGCGLFGVAESVVFPPQDVHATVLSSMFPVEKDYLKPTKFLPAIENLYQSFRELRLLLPAVFEAEEFDSQFKYYNSVIGGIGFLRQNEPVQQFSNVQLNEPSIIQHQTLGHIVQTDHTQL